MPVVLPITRLKHHENMDVGATAHGHGLVKVEDQVQLADIAKVAIQALHEMVDLLMTFKQVQRWFYFCLKSEKKNTSKEET